MSPDELKEKMLALSEPVTDKTPPHWESWRWQLWQHVTEGRDPFRLFEWPEVYHTMLHSHWLHIPAEELRVMPDWDRQSLLVAPGKFQPADLLPSSLNSASLVHQAYNLFIWQRETGRKIDELETIAEIGGGYGAMALVARRLGFTGRYIIYDLPEFLLLQEFFLSNNGITAEYATFKPDRPNAKKKQRLSTDLVIGCYSLSEMDEDLRSAFLTQHPATSYLFLYSRKFEQYNNMDYFGRQLPQTVFWNYLPALIPESYYAIGGVPGPADYYLPRHIILGDDRWYLTTLVCPRCAQPGLYACPDPAGDQHCCAQCSTFLSGYLVEDSAAAEELRKAIEL